MCGIYLMRGLSMGFISRTVSHTRRYKEIISILVKYGMGDLVRSLGITDALPFLRRLVPTNLDSVPISDLTRGEEVRMALEELGPAFIKLGQMLSNRPDILPPEITVELARLQDSVPPFDGEIAIRIIENELGKPISELFASFDVAPVASASIGQVHRATLFDGQLVAVKVQRPDIEKTVKIDLEILQTFAGLAEKNIASLRYVKPTGVVAEFERHMLHEMDYRHERRNLERFRRLYGTDDGLYIPQTYPSLSSKCVFTMEFINGVKVSDIADENLLDYDRALIARRGSQSLLEQVFIRGYFHADPHPGNIMIMADNRVCFVDFGMMGVIMPAQQDLLGSLLLAIKRRDSAVATALLLDVAAAPDHPQVTDIEYELQLLIDNYIDVSLDDLDVSEVVGQLVSLIYKFQLSFPSNLTLMFKSIAMIEGVGHQLDPQFQLSEMVAIFAPKLTKHKLSPRRLVGNVYTTMMDYKRMLSALPKDIRSVLRKMKDGQLKMEVQHNGLEPLRATLDALSYRLTFGLVLAALIIGSSIMVNVKTEGIMHTLGLVGYGVGAITSVILLIVVMVRAFRT
jgi:ubiquinone biosynthesis protein